MKKDLESSISILMEAKKRLGRGGYAYDIIENITDPEYETSSEQDADSLFRTLVIDEAWSVSSANVVYLAACSIIEEYLSGPD